MPGLAYAGSPSAAYGAAALSPGEWNVIDASIGGPQLLFDLSGGSGQGVAVYSFGVFGRTDSGADLTQVRHVTRKREGGWVLEASFPLQALGVGPGGQETARISCDFLFVDRDLEDETARPSYHRLWTRTRSRKNTATFGVLLLEE